MLGIWNRDRQITKAELLLLELETSQKKPQLFLYVVLLRGTATWDVARPTSQSGVSILEVNKQNHFSVTHYFKAAFEMCCNLLSFLHIHLMQLAVFFLHTL